MSLVEDAQARLSGAVRYASLAPAGCVHLSGSRGPVDDTRFFEVTDLLGQVFTALVYFPRALIVSPIPPSGCVLATGSAILNWGVLHFAHGAVETAPRAIHHSPQRIALTLDGTEVHPLSHKKIISDIQDAFGLHTTDLANMLEVSRQSVHSWKSDAGSAPGISSVTKLLALHAAAVEWRKHSPSSAPGWLLHSPIQDKTFKEWLMRVASGSVQMSYVMEKIKESLSPSAANRSMRDLKVGSREPTAFEDFVDSLGTEPLPSGPGNQQGS